MNKIKRKEAQILTIMAYNLTPIGSNNGNNNSYAAVSAIKVTAKGLTIKIKPTNIRTHTHTYSVHMTVDWRATLYDSANMPHTHTHTHNHTHMHAFLSCILIKINFIFMTLSLLVWHVSHCLCCWLLVVGCLVSCHNLYN